MDQVYMDIPAVRNMAKSFGEVSQVLSRINKALEAMVNILKSTAFVGAVGGTAVIQFIESIRPYIQQMGQKCGELQKDVSASVEAYSRGDQAGATRFY